MTSKRSRAQQFQSSIPIRLVGTGTRPGDGFRREFIRFLETTSQIDFVFHRDNGTLTRILLPFGPTGRRGSNWSTLCNLFVGTGIPLTMGSVSSTSGRGRKRVKNTDSV